MKLNRIYHYVVLLLKFPINIIYIYINDFYTLELFAEWRQCVPPCPAHKPLTATKPTLTEHL